MNKSQRQVLQLYRALLKEAKAFPSYNYREYAIAKIKHTFHCQKDMTDPQAITTAMKKGKEALEMMKRQCRLQSMYNPNVRLVIEGEERK